ncbi:unnamed protein product [Clonostachys byssicola]|uniref:Glucose-methanol-choline oxidoreductase N-terminal domain-containing protein n=1 Tax=Clonostachys byssicola TaxID=160290 RepID=A0A9N9Y7A4_9HYPO|nr:unnamed protein product [Clonostachys byssicola]
MWPFTTKYPEKTLQDAVVAGEYDYIIVGGGTAGCVVASRLSEDANVKVLVIEKGFVNDSLATRVPLTSCTFDAVPGNVARQTEPNEVCEGKRLSLVHSESLGGCSRINGMLYTRGLPAIYDEWASITGFEEWNWRGVEPYFERLESKLEQTPGRASVQVVQHPPMFGLYKFLEDASSSMGLPVVNQPNQPNAPAAGYSYLDYTIDSEGNRHSALRSFLPTDLAIERQGRLTICTGVIATSLELDVADGRVKGVHVKPVGREEPEFLAARREVILCGGAILTPQLLQLSGVGPASVLERVGLEVKRDLPAVGVGFNDHYGIPICLELPFDQTYHFMERNILQGIYQFVRFCVWGTGFLRSPATQAAINFKSSCVDAKSSEIVLGADELDGTKLANLPDVEVMIVPANTVPGSNVGKSLATLFTCLLRPKSEGKIQVWTTDPEADPEIHTDVLTDQEDVAVARKALRFSMALAERLSRTAADAFPSRIFLAPKNDTDDELDEFARVHIRAILHHSSSCRMGREDKGGVVDGNLRVHGFSNLRVADASVFPTIPATHTMAPTYMVAERCADLIRKTWAD